VRNEVARAVDETSLISVHQLVATHTGLTIFETEGIDQSDYEAACKLYTTAVDVAHDVSLEWHPVYGIVNTVLVSRGVA
jgi:hypothetical protein